MDHPSRQSYPAQPSMVSRSAAIRPRRHRSPRSCRRFISLCCEPEDRVAVKPHASADLSCDPVFVRQPDPRQAGELSRLQRRARAIRRAPRMSMTLISPPARWGSAWRRHCSRRWCRDYVAAHGMDEGSAAKAAWSRWSVMPKWTRAISSRRWSKAGSMACAIAGGSSTITARASTPSCAKGCGRSSSPCSVISDGTWSS